MTFDTKKPYSVFFVSLDQNINHSIYIALCFNLFNLNLCEWYAHLLVLEKTEHCQIFDLRVGVRCTTCCYRNGDRHLTQAEDARGTY